VFLTPKPRLRSTASPIGLEYRACPTFEETDFEEREVTIMSCHTSPFRWIVALVAVALMMGATAELQAQVAGGGQIAGVEVDPNGVLRTKVFLDRSGQLTKQRMAAARAQLDPNLARPSDLRLVSINRLEKVVGDRVKAAHGLTDEIRYLAGLTQITHVFFYPESGDIVVGGPAEGFGHDVSGRVIGIHTGKATLQLEDLVAALRAYGPGGQRTNMIRVSIDPTPEGLQKMQEFLVRISGRIVPSDAQKIATGLRENLGKQIVTIEGVSPKTHFAQVLVEADYRMKLIGIGLERPPVGIVSYVAKANPRDVARNAMQRWYFTPNYDCVKVTDDEMAMQLVGEGVKLIGENELIGANGARAVAGRADRASQAFVKSFTAKYPELARVSPVYGQMRNLIDMAVAAAFIQERDYYGKAKWEMSVFRDESVYAIENYPAPTQVESAVNVIWKGNTLMTPIGGGVEIVAHSALATDRLIEDKGNKLAEQRSKLSIDLKEGQWWWDAK
jgi:hypothetical protein